MAVYDRWHRDPAPGDQPCKCGTAKNPLYASAMHKRGKRWQVRWRDAAGRQPRKNFDLKIGSNPDLHADAYDAKISRELDTDPSYDPDAGEITLRAYGEEWRKSRTHDDVTADDLERRLRLHVYEDPERPGSGRAPKGGIAIGQRKMRELAKRPMLVQSWVQAMPLAPSTARVVLGHVSAICAAAVDEGIIGRNPCKSPLVTWPGKGRSKAVPWTADRVAAMSQALPARYKVLPWLGAGTGMRQGEMFGLAVTDIQFLGKDPHITVERQVKIVGGKPHFAPLKNRKPHEVPLAPTLAGRLARHLEAYPAVKVTLPWHDPRDKQRHGKPVTVRLVLSPPRGGATDRVVFDRQWWAAQERCGITPKRERGEKRAPAREEGCHVLRHTAASTWLRARIDIVRVASWLGDTPAVVWSTYAHLIPGDSSEDGRAAVDSFAASCAPDVPPESATGR